jgi:hypothetical protein
LSRKKSLFQKSKRIKMTPSVYIKTLLICLLSANLFGQNISPITHPIPPNTLPNGWSFWSESSLRCSANFSDTPVPCIMARIYNSGQWALNANTISLAPGDTWVFSAVISGSFLGELSQDGTANMGIIALNNEGSIINWTHATKTLPSGTFGWTKISVQFTIPPDGSISKIIPRFYSENGGGELYIAGATLGRVNQPDNLFIPSTIVSPSSNYITPLTPKINNNNHDYPIGWSFWSESSLRASSAFYNYPVPHIEARVYNDKQWAVNAKETNVNPGETWTFTAIISGRFLGELAHEGATFMGIIALNNQGTIVHWTPVEKILPSGTFGWTRISVQYAIPTDGSVSKIIPRFYSPKGGGELYISNASLLPSNKETNLVIPASAIPISKVNISPYVNEAQTGSESSWAVWSHDGTAKIALHKTPYNKVHFVSHSGTEWSLFSKSVEVRPGETWTFNTLLWTNQDVTSDAGSRHCFMGITTFDGNGNIIDWNAAIQEITPNANEFTLSYTIPSNVSYIQPRFYSGNWSGILSIIEANLLPTGNPTNIIGVKAIGVTTSKDHFGVFSPGEEINWSIKKYRTTDVLTDITLRFQITDAYGKIIMDNGTDNTLIDSSIPFTPAHPGYYEINVFGEAVENNKRVFLEGRASAIVIKNANPAFGSNPFSIQGTPDALINRLGFTWDRPLMYNIKYIANPNNPLYKKVPSSDELDEYKNLWRNYVQDANNNFNKAKYIDCYQIWNEPMNEKAFPGTSQAECVGFIDMLKASKEGIHSVNPTKKILLNLEHPTSYDEFSRLTSSNGEPSTNFYDIMAIHPYTRAYWDKYSLCPEGSYGSINTGKTEIDQQGNSHPVIIDNNGGPLLLDLENYNRYTVGKPMWSTEFGWPTRENFSWSTSELNQARYLVRSALLQLSANVKKVSVFRWQDFDWSSLDGSMGVIREDGLPKPALCAFSVLAQTIHDLPYFGYLNRPVNEGCFVFGDDVHHKTILVLWRPDIESKIQISLPAGEKNIIDMFGNEITTSAPITSLPIGRSPIYVVIKNKNPNELSFQKNGTPSHEIFNVSKGY